MGLSTHTASAQSLPVVGPPSGFAIGDFQPASSAAKAAGKNQLNAELRYGLPGVPLTPTRSVIAVGYQHGSSNGNSSTVVPLTFTEYYGTGNWSPFSASKPYVGAGTGVYFINQSGKSSKAALGGAFSIGYNFSILFAEAQYQIVPNANGFVFDIGARF
jgi:outer membrane protein W